MDSTQIKTLIQIVNEALITSPSNGNGYGLALAVCILVAILFASIFFIDRHLNAKRVDKLQSSREDARTKFEGIIRDEFSKLGDAHKESISDLRKELSDANAKFGERVDSLNSRLSRLEGKFEK